MISLSPLPNPISSSPTIRIPHAQSHGTLFSWKSHAKPPLTKTYKPNSSASASAVAQEEKEEEFQVLTATRSEYNNIVILESQRSKLLLLDDSGNIHSILYKDQKWTNSYWDEFSSLPAVIPQGPVAVLGLGGGTVAHQLLHFWPSLCVHGWELDEVLIDRARQFFGLSELEVINDAGGVLLVHVGDALSPLASVEGGYAGIIVDLFSNAQVLPELEKVETWLEMREKLMPNGRIMVNCGGASHDGQVSDVERGWEANPTIKAMCEAFGEELVSWKRMHEHESANFLAFTGPSPDLKMWSASVPEKLSLAVKLWWPCEAL